MKIRIHSGLFATSVLTLLLTAGCSYFSSKPSAPDSKASPEAQAAIAGAEAAIKKAKANDWIWVNTEKFAKEAQAAAEKGDNATAIKLANKAKTEADDAIAQYNFESSHTRGLNGIQQ